MSRFVAEHVDSSRLRESVETLIEEPHKKAMTVYRQKNVIRTEKMEAVPGELLCCLCRSCQCEESEGQRMSRSSSVVAVHSRVAVLVCVQKLDGSTVPLGTSEECL